MAKMVSKIVKRAGTLNRHLRVCVNVFGCHYVNMDVKQTEFDNLMHIKLKLKKQTFCSQKARMDLNKKSVPRTKTPDA